MVDKNGNTININAADIIVNVDGVEMTLQAAIDGGKISGGSDVVVVQVLSSDTTKVPSVALLTAELAKKQNLLKAGTGISIASDGTISVTSSGGSVSIDTSMPTYPSDSKVPSTKLLAAELAKKADADAEGKVATTASEVKFTEGDGTVTNLQTKVTELDSAIGCEDYTADTIRITFPTQLANPYSLAFTEASADDADYDEKEAANTELAKVIYTDYEGAALLGLSYDYKAYGKPSKLAIFFVGSADYLKSSYTTFPTLLQPYIDYMRKNGYCVLCPHGFGDARNWHGFSTPFSLGNFVKAYNYVISHYNVEKDGVYVWGRSSGAACVLSFAYSSGAHIKAAALQHPKIGIMAFEHNIANGGDDILKKYIFDDDENYAWTSDYLIANAHKILPYEDMLIGITDATIEEKVNAILTNTDLSSKSRTIPFPLKIWAASRDTSVSYDKITEFCKTITNGSGVCEFKQMKSLPIDTDLSQHHIADYTGSTSHTTTKSGETLDISDAYIELVEWFDRH